MIKTSSVIILPAIDKAAQGAGPRGNEAGRQADELKRGRKEAGKLMPTDTAAILHA